MNERIKELMDQAYDSYVDPIYGLEAFRFSREKFAELIIKECMSMCDETQADYLKHRKSTIDFDEKNIFAEGEAASGVIKHKMKKRFGIE